MKVVLKIVAAIAGIALLTVLVLLFKPITPTIDPIVPRDSTRFWIFDEGYRIAYTRVDAGEISRPPLIFLHGGPGGYIHSSVISTLSPLADMGHDVYFYDQSGTGLSSRRDRPKDTTIESHVGDLRKIVEQKISAEQVVLIGHSAGAIIASHYASESPERVAGLVLSSPAIIRPTRHDEDGRWVNESRYPVPDHLAFRDVASTYAEDTSALKLPLRALASLVIAQLFDRRFASDREMDAALNTLASGFTRNMVCDPANARPEEGGGGAYSRTGANFYPDEFDDHRAQMRAAEIPVLVLHGQCDIIPYAGVYEYVDLFPDAQYRMLEDAGHVFWWDRPDAYRNAIADFLRKRVE